MIYLLTIVLPVQIKHEVYNHHHCGTQCRCFLNIYILVPFQLPDGISAKYVYFFRTRILVEKKNVHIDTELARLCLKRTFKEYYSPCRYSKNGSSIKRQSERDISGLHHDN